MKKFTSTVMALAGAVAVLWLAYTVFHYGAVNMRRVEDQSYAYRLHWADRR